MNLESLLKPISALAPCGEDLSYSPEFDAIIEFKREDDPTLDQGAWITSLKVADWGAVQSECERLLSTRSKDLRLMVWLAEANTMNFGFTGLLNGLTLCNMLCDRYWESLYPLPEGHDQEERAGNIAWFLNRMVSLVGLCSVTRGRSGSYHLQQLQAAKALLNSPEKSAAPAVEAVTMEQFIKALKDTPKDHVKEILNNIAACHEALSKWQTLIDVKLGDSRPGFTGAREALEAAHHEVQRLAREVGVLAGEKTAAEPDAVAVPSVIAPNFAGGPIQTREQAIAQLREVAAFFRATEPHSPVPYLAEKAATWGEISLHEWLRTVVKDRSILSGLEEVLGVTPPASLDG